MITAEEQLAKAVLRGDDWKMIAWMWHRQIEELISNRRETMSLIHRYGMTGGAQCGAGPDKFGHLKLSTTGAPSTVTCPACAEPPKMTREAALAALSAAAAKPRDKS